MKQPKEVLIAAFRQVFDLQYNKLCNYANSFLQDQDASQDIVQEVFIKIWENKKDLIESDAIRFYLYTAVRNNCLTYLKKNKKNNVVSLSNHLEAEEPYPDLCERTSPDFKELLRKGLEKLPPKCREVFLLSRMGQHSYQDIANQLGISVKTVENQIGKALKVLRAFAEKQKVHPAASYILFFMSFFGRE